MGAYEQIEPFYKMYVQGPRPTPGWRETNTLIATWLGLGLLGEVIEFGNGHLGPTYEGIPVKPTPYLMVGIVYPSWSLDPAINTERIRAHATFIAGIDQPITVSGNWHDPVMATAKAMLESRFKFSIA